MRRITCRALIASPELVKKAAAHEQVSVEQYLHLTRTSLWGGAFEAQALSEYLGGEVCAVNDVMKMLYVCKGDPSHPPSWTCTMGLAHDHYVLLKNGIDISYEPTKQSSRRFRGGSSSSAMDMGLAVSRDAPENVRRTLTVMMRNPRPQDSAYYFIPVTQMMSIGDVKTDLGLRLSVPASSIVMRILDHGPILTDYEYVVGGTLYATLTLCESHQTGQQAQPPPPPSTSPPQYGLPADMLGVFEAGGWIWHRYDRRVSQSDEVPWRHFPFLLLRPKLPIAALYVRVSETDTGHAELRRWLSCALRCDVRDLAFVVLPPQRSQENGLPGIQIAFGVPQSGPVARGGSSRNPRWHHAVDEDDNSSETPPRGGQREVMNDDARPPLRRSRSPRRPNAPTVERNRVVHVHVELPGRTTWRHVMVYASPDDVVGYIREVVARRIQVDVINVEIGPLHSGYALPDAAPVPVGPLLATLNQPQHQPAIREWVEVNWPPVDLVPVNFNDVPISLVPYILLHSDGQVERWTMRIVRGQHGTNALRAWVTDRMRVDAWRVHVTQVTEEAARAYGFEYVMVALALPPSPEIAAISGVRDGHRNRKSQKAKVLRHKTIWLRASGLMSLVDSTSPPAYPPGGTTGAEVSRSELHFLHWLCCCCCCACCCCPLVLPER